MVNLSRVFLRLSLCLSLSASAILFSCSHRPTLEAIDESVPPRSFEGKWSGSTTYSSFGRVFGSHDNVQCDEQSPGRSEPTLILNIEQSGKTLRLSGSAICHRNGKLLVQDYFPATDFEIANRDLLLNGEKVGLITDRTMSISSAGRTITGRFEGTDRVRFTYEVYGNPGEARFSGAFTQSSNVVRYL